VAYSKRYHIKIARIIPFLNFLHFIETNQPGFEVNLQIIQTAKKETAGNFITFGIARDIEIQA
jgi:hypothetical protein